MRSVTAIIWDYDGTLADTREKNLNVTRKIIEHVTGSPGDALPALRNVDSYDAVHKKYANWRELYIHEYGLDEQRTEYAGSLWTKYQLQDDTPAPLFDGVATAIHSLSAYPHGIFSQNSSRNIAAALRHKGLAQEIAIVVGYEEVPAEKQKPDPEGLLTCIETLTKFKPGNIVYIGDHETDATCAFLANTELQKRYANVRVTHVAAAYSGNNTDSWSHAPEYQVESPGEILTIVSKIEGRDGSR